MKKLLKFVLITLAVIFVSAAPAFAAEQTYRSFSNGSPVTYKKVKYSIKTKKDSAGEYYGQIVYTKKGKTTVVADTDVYWNSAATDGKYIYYTKSKNDRLYLYRYTIKSGKKKLLAKIKITDDESPGFGIFRSVGNYMLIRHGKINAVVNMKTGKVRNLYYSIADNEPAVYKNKIYGYYDDLKTNKSVAKVFSLSGKVQKTFKNTKFVSFKTVGGKLYGVVDAGNDRYKVYRLDKNLKKLKAVTKKVKWEKIPAKYMY